MDVNLLLYAYNKASDQHEAARKWVEVALSEPEPFCLTWPTVLAFIRIMTNTRAFSHPLPIRAASEIVSGWLDQPNVRILEPGDRHWELLKKLLIDCQASGPLAMDAQLAAIALEHGAKLFSTDRDFARFTGLKFENPLV